MRNAVDFSRTSAVESLSGGQRLEPEEIHHARQTVLEEPS